MLGTGFIGQFHHQGLRHVPAARAVACFGRDAGRREAFATRNGYASAYDSIEAVCADPEVDLVIVSLPNELHVAAVEAAARQGKGVACTKPLGRTGDGGRAGTRGGERGRCLARLPRERRVQRGDGPDARHDRGRRHRHSRHVPGPRGAQRPPRAALLGRGDRWRRCPARHGVARHRGRALPVRQGARGAGRVRVGRHPRASRPHECRGQRGDDHALRGWPRGHHGRLVVEQGRPRGPVRGGGDRRHGSSRTWPRRPCGRSSSDPRGISPRRRTRTPAGCSRCRTRRTPTATTRCWGTWWRRSGRAPSPARPSGTGWRSTASSTRPTDRSALGAGRPSASRRGPPRVTTTPATATALTWIGLAPRPAGHHRRDAGGGPRAGEPVVRRCHRGGRPRAPVRHRPLAHPGRGDVPALRVVSGVPPHGRAVDDVPHPGRGRQRPAAGDVHRAGARPGRGHPGQLHASDRPT